MLNRIGRRIGKAALLLLCAALWFAGGAAASSILQVYQGGTGNASFTAYSILAGGTTSTGALQQVSGLGSANQVLTSNGAGQLPTWQAATGGISREAWVSGGRITLSSTLAVPTSDIPGATIIYYLPFVSNLIWTYDSSVWTQHNVGTGLTENFGSLTPSTLYYNYVYNSGGIMTLFTTTSGTAVQDGVIVESLDHSKTFVGMCYANGSGTLDDTAAKRNVANYYNAVPRPCVVIDDSAHSTTSTTLVQIGSVQLELTAVIPQFIHWQLHCGECFSNSVSSGFGGDITIGQNASSDINAVSRELSEGTQWAGPMSYAVVENAGTAPFHVTRFANFEAVSGSTFNINQFTQFSAVGLNN